MSEPTRLKDDPTLGAILRSADDDAPSAASRRAIALALGVSTAAAVTASASTATAATTATATTAGSAVTAGSAATAATGAVGATLAAKTGISLVGKLVIGLALATGAGVAVKKTVLDRQPEHAPVESTAAAETKAAVEPPRPSVSPTPAPSEPGVAPAAVETVVVGEPTPVAPTAHPAEPTPAKKVTPRTTAKTPPSADDAPAATDPVPTATAKQPLAAEVLLVDAALVALRKGDAATALNSLDEYERRFPAGALAPEAAAARIEATFASGDAAKGRALADAFLAKHPDSPLAQRVRKLGQ